MSEGKEPKPVPSSSSSSSACAAVQLLSDFTENEALHTAAMFVGVSSSKKAAAGPESEVVIHHHDDGSSSSAHAIPHGVHDGKGETTPDRDKDPYLKITTQLILKAMEAVGRVNGISNSVFYNSIVGTFTILTDMLLVENWVYDVVHLLPLQASWRWCLDMLRENKIPIELPSREQILVDDPRLGSTSHWLWNDLTYRSYRHLLYVSLGIEHLLDPRSEGPFPTKDSVLDLEVVGLSTQNLLVSYNEHQVHPFKRYCDKRAQQLQKRGLVMVPTENPPKRQRLG